jgi:hypothetical protein
VNAALIDLAGGLLIALGIFIGYQARRRRFDRTNVYGVERSRTYWDGVKARAADMTLRYAAAASVSTGTVVLAWAHIDTWGGIIILPLCILVLFMLLGT